VMIDCAEGLSVADVRSTYVDVYRELRELEGIARRQTGKRGVLPLDALLAFGADEGAAALGLESVPEAVVDLDDPQLSGVGEPGLYEALVFSCDGTVLRKTLDQ